MKVFTYYDYIKCIHSVRLNKGQGLAEEQAKYKIGKNKKEINKQDKVIKTVLKNKDEIAKLINGFLKLNKKVYSKDLIEYTKTDITKKYKEEDEIIYKLKKEEMYFLVEYKTKIDNKISERILNSSVDIIHEWSKLRKLGVKTKYPLIVPIVIYTGEKKWKTYNNFKDVEVVNYGYENKKIKIEYNLIEINRISIKRLLEQKSLFGCVMILKKARDEKELEYNINLVIKSCRDEEYKKEIQNIIRFYIKDVSNKTKTKILKSLKK